MSQVSDYTNYQNSTQRLQDSFDAERAETRANQEKELKRKEEEEAETVTKAKQDYNQRLEQERAQARDEIKRLKEEVYDQNGKSSARNSKSEQAAKNEFSNYREQVKKEADRKVAQAQEQLSKSSVHQNDLTDDKVASALAAQKNSQYQEVASLENELDQYRNSGQDADAARAKARAETVTENERGNLDEKNRIIQSYERQIAAMKRNEEAMAKHYDRQLTEAMYDSNANAQRQVTHQKQEFSKIFKDDLADKARIEKSYQADVQNLKNRQNHNSVQLINQTLADRERIAKDKDQTYQKYIAEKDQQVAYDLNERDAKIKELQTTDDTLKVSPFVVKKINDAAEKRNFEQLNEAQSVHDKNLMAEKTRDQDDRRAMSRDYQAQIAGIHRDSRREIDVESRQMRDAYQDLQNNHEVQMASVGEKGRSQAERLYQQNAMALAEAQKDKLDALNDQKDVLGYEKNVQLDEVNQAHRNQDREWFMKANDLRRNYEAKLNEERDEHSKMTHEMRLEYDKKLRDRDRMSKRDIDDRVRSYEHQLAQQELAFKEKERFLTEHYEEELDKMKRTNAHLIQTKS